MSANASKEAPSILISGGVFFVMKRDLFFKFFIIVLSVVGIFLLFSSFVAYAYKQNQPKAPDQYFVDEFGNESVVKPEDKSSDTNFLAAPERTNFLIVGVDAITEGLTDVMIVGCFDTNTQQVNMLSIPRDTKINLDPKTTERIEQNYGTYYTAKINSVNNYVGKEDGMEYTKLEVENLLNIKIDYYAVINTKAFREIVDILGGVRMTLDRDYYYNDPLQDLVIDLEAGDQVLDGEAAEGLVRFRDDYVRGDEERIEVQHRFLKELVSQVLNKDNIIKNAPELLNQMIKYVRTDFPLTDAPMYLQYIEFLKGENFRFYTLPGHGGTEMDGNGNEISYFFYDREEANELVGTIFYGEGQVTSDNANDGLEIKILNGSGRDNAAGEKQEELLDAGFNITEIGTYTGGKQETTRIFVKDPETGFDLVPYFESAKVELDTINMTDGCDIVIVIGEEE